MFQKDKKLDINIIYRHGNQWFKNLSKEAFKELDTCNGTARGTPLPCRHANG